MQLYKCFVGSSGDSLAFDMLGVICIKPAGALKMLVLRFFLIVRAGISAIQDSTPSAHPDNSGSDRTEAGLPTDS